MVFSSTIFIFIFLPIVLAVDRLLPLKARNIFLIFVSLLFFSWSQPQYLWLLLFNILINYCGEVFVASKKGAEKKVFLVIQL